MAHKVTCLWRNCKTIIEVDGSLDIPGFATMGGFCEFHHSVYRIELMMFEKMAKNLKGKDGIDLKNQMWRDNRKEYNKISKRACRVVESMEAVKHAQ